MNRRTRISHRRNALGAPRHARRGATVLEMSLVLMVLLVTTMGMIDLGRGVFRYHVLANAARHGARQAIIHGSLASVTGEWGPTQISTAANATSVPIVDGVIGGINIGMQPLLIGCDLSQTNIVATWPSGDNEEGDPVTVQVTSPFQPVLTWIVPGTAITLSASSTMQIAH